MTTFYFRLVGIEEALWRMICGVYRLMAKQLPAWAYHVVFVSVGPVIFHLMSVMALTCIWLVIMAGPFAVARILKLPSWWSYGSMIWAVLAVTGSILELKHLATRRKASLL